MANSFPELSIPPNTISKSSSSSKLPIAGVPTKNCSASKSSSTSPFLEIMNKCLLLDAIIISSSPSKSKSAMAGAPQTSSPTSISQPSINSPIDVTALTIPSSSTKIISLLPSSVISNMAGDESILIPISKGNPPWSRRTSTLKIKFWSNNVPSSNIPVKNKFNGIDYNGEYSSIWISISWLFQVVE